MVNRILPKIAFALLSLAVPAFAQFTCTNNIDQNGNVCTVEYTEGYNYSPYYGYSFPVASEDGQAEPADFLTSVAEESDYYAFGGMPFDPLKLLGYVPTDGSIHTVLSGYVVSGSFKQVNTVPTPHTVGAVMFTQSWAFTETNSAAGTYPYTWNGTFVIPWVCTHVGRYGCDHVPSTGTVQMSAIHN